MTMSNDVIQAEYEMLESIAARFVRLATANGDLFHRLQRNVQTLEQGDWQGKGSATFFREMNGEIYPALERLIDALQQAQGVTLEIKQTLQEAEAEAAALFQGNHQKTEGGGLWSKISEWVHGGLDVLGFAPVVGELADGVNALIYLGEGRYVEAGISAAAMVPILGDAGKVGKWGVKAGRELLEEGAERTAKGVAEGVAEQGAREGVETAAEQGVRHGDEVLKFGELRPNAAYVRNGYEYTTDELGRVQRVQGELNLSSAPRTPHQTAVGRLGNPGDEGGHLIGAQFGGTSEGVNLTPQNWQLNRGKNSPWRQMESEWAQALKEGKQVKVDIQLHYPPGNQSRPSRFLVEYTVDGEFVQRIFRNRPGG
jgi:WXG100 family type VII secretion target